MDAPQGYYKFSELLKDYDVIDKDTNLNLRLTGKYVLGKTLRVQAKVKNKLIYYPVHRIIPSTL